MNSLLPVCVFLSLFSSIFLPVLAQERGSVVVKSGGEHRAVPVKFIEGIVIERQIISSAAQVREVIPVNIKGSFYSPDIIEKSISVQFKYAQLLNRNVESMVNLTLFNFIEEWWQTRYQHGGNTKSGVDCSAFSGLLLSTLFSIRAPRTAKEQFAACEKKARANLTEGDLVFFNTRGGVSHVGIYLGEGYFVHASTGNGVTINNLSDDYYHARFLGGGRMLPDTETGPCRTGVAD